MVGAGCRLGGVGWLGTQLTRDSLSMNRCGPGQRSPGPHRGSPGTQNWRLVTNDLDGVVAPVQGRDYRGQPLLSGHMDGPGLQVRAEPAVVFRVVEEVGRRERETVLLTQGAMDLLIRGRAVAVDAVGRAPSDGSKGAVESDAQDARVGSNA